MSFFDFESKIDGVPVSEYVPPTEEEKEEVITEDTSGTTKYCRECGGEIKEKAVICIHCGCATGYKEKETKFGVKEVSGEQHYSKWIALGLCFFFGLIGIHRLYVNDFKGGVLMAICFFFTIWLFFPIFITVGVALYDFINICIGNELAEKKLY